MKQIKKLFSIIALLGLLTACGSQTDDKTIVVKLGVVGDSSSSIWEVVNKNLEKENIRVELEIFSDGIYANKALADGELDLNSFQHNIFLEQEIEDKGYELTAIGNTIVTPLNIYSDKIKDVSEIKSGDTVLIPNNPTNSGRALKVLERAGLIKVDASKGYLPALVDIQENPLNIKIEEADPALIIQLLPDVAAGITNSGMVLDNGLDPINDAIFHLDVDSKDSAFIPYINIIVARTEDKDNDVYKKVVDAFHQDNVADHINEKFKNAFVPAW